MDEQRRQAAQVAEQRRGQRLVRIGAGEVGRDDVIDRGAVEQRITPHVLVERRAPAGQVGAGREQRGRFGQALAGIAQDQHQRQREIAAGTVAGDRQARIGIGAALRSARQAAQTSSIAAGNGCSGASR